MSAASRPDRDHPRTGEADLCEDTRYLDVLRVVSAFAVVVFHVSGGVMARSGGPPSCAWWLGNVYHAACRWCVPMFVLISGALLLDPDKDESAGVFARKRYRRLVVPMLFWTVLYYAARARGGAELTLPLVLRELLKGRPTDFLWFLFMLPGLYLLTPSLRLYLRSASTSNRASVVVILLTLAMLHSLVASWQCATRPTVLTMFIPFLGYYVCGYHLRATDTARVPLAVLLATMGICTGIIAGVTGVLVPLYGWRKGAFFHDFLSLPVIVMSLAVFMSLAKLAHTDKPVLEQIGRWCRVLAPSTLGVYLCHPLLLRFAERHGQALTTSGWAAAGIPIVSVLVFVGSTAIVMVVLKIPYLRRIVS